MSQSSDDTGRYSSFKLNYAGERLDTFHWLKEAMSCFELTELEFMIYFLLVKNGPRKAQSITATIGANRVMVYKSLKNLLSKDLVSSTLNCPSCYIAAPINTVINHISEVKMKEISTIEKNKGKVLELFTPNSIESLESIERFSILAGLKTGYSRFEKMGVETEKELLFMNPLILTPGENAVNGLSAIFNNVSKKKARTKFITHVTSENIREIKEIIENTKTADNLCQVRHTDSSNYMFPSLIISDAKQALIGLDPWSKISSISKRQLWRSMYLNNPFFTQTLTFLFNMIWDKSTDIAKNFKL